MVTFITNRKIKESHSFVKKKNFFRSFSSFTMRKCIEGPVSRAAITYVGLMVNLRFRVLRKGWGNLGEGEKKSLTR